MKSEPFPLPLDEPTKKLTVVIPAHNEEERLPGMLKTTLAYLQDRQDQDRYGLALFEHLYQCHCLWLLRFPQGICLHIRFVSSYTGHVLL